jgi:hypothetical protein
MELLDAKVSLDKETEVATLTLKKLVEVVTEEPNTIAGRKSMELKLKQLLQPLSKPTPRFS